MFTLETVVDAVAKQNSWFLNYVQPESVRKELLNLNEQSAEMARSMSRQTVDFYTTLAQQVNKTIESNHKFFSATK